MKTIGGMSAEAASSVVMRLDAIKVTGRHRTDLGDIAGLAASIAELGLLHPVVVTPDGLLVAGERRLAAARRLGWDEIDARIAHGLDDAVALLKAERDENTCRKDFTPTEEAAVYQQLLELERPRAKAQQGARTDLHPTSPKVSGKSGGDPAKERAAEAATGKAGRYKTLDKVLEVQQIAADETQPEPVREEAEAALKAIDATGRVDGSHRRVKEAEERAAAPSPSPAVGELVESSENVQNARYVHAFMRVLCRVDDLLEFDPERLAQLLDREEIDQLDRFGLSVAQFIQRIHGTTGLRVIEGGS